MNDLYIINRIASIPLDLLEEIGKQILSAKEDYANALISEDEMRFRITGAIIYLRGEEKWNVNLLVAHNDRYIP